MTEIHSVTTNDVREPDAPPPALRRWGPLVLLAALATLAYGLGLHRYLTFQAIAENREALKDFVAAHWIGAAAIYAAVYVAAVALSLPGAALLTVLGGFLFGWLGGAPLAAVSATTGAAIVFLIVKTSFGEALARRAGPLARKLSTGFREDAFHYLLFLRLVPAFPFFIVNAVSGLAGIRLSTFLAATLIGILPGSLVFSYLGTGLDSVIDAQAEAYRACIASGAAACGFDISLGSLVTREIVIAFSGLGVLALVPVAIRRWKGRVAA